MMTEAAALSLFARALDLEPGDRAAFVAHEAAGDPGLAARVMALIAADEVVEQSLSGGLGTSFPLPSPDISAWRLDRMIGAGGMGSVWKAHRTDGLFEQVVAVKFMRARAGSIDLGPLIDAERRSLARMDHDNIARILDGGTTAEGLHYIVMEHVAGARLDDHAATLPPAQRVALIRQAAAALAHAHRAGIVHCDVKPANLLVTPGGRVKLIDFGIARLEGGGQGLPDGMTRSYASPERLAGQPPTTADDIWSLAVTLRELLTGAPDGTALPPMRNAADLQAVLNRATDADPDRRYASIDAFDTDLMRWQQAKTVSARPNSATYVLARFAQRRPGTVAAIGATLAGLVGALAVIASLYVSADRARADAETRFGELRQLARFMIFDLNGMLEQVPGATPARAALADRAQFYLDTLAAASTDSGLLAESAAGLTRLAEVQGVPSRPNLGQGPQAAANLDRARGILDRLIADAPTPALHALRARTLYYRAVLTGTQDGDPAGQGALARLAQDDIVAALPGADDATRADLEALALGAAMTEADALTTAGDVQAALALQTAAEARLQALPDTVRAGMDWPWETARIAMVIGDSLYWTGDLPGARGAYARAQGILEQGIAAAPLNRRLLTALHMAQYSQSAVLADLGDAQAGLEAAEASQRTAGRLLDWDPTDRLALRMQSVSEGQRALMLRALGRTAEALPIVEARVARARAATEAAPDDLDAARSLAIALGMRAGMVAELNGAGAACPLWSETRAAWDALDARQPLSALDRQNDYAFALAGLAACP